MTVPATIMACSLWIAIGWLLPSVSELIRAKAAKYRAEADNIKF